MICIYQAFLISSECNILYASTAEDPSYINFFDMGTGQVLPTYIDAIQLSATQYGQAGAIE